MLLLSHGPNKATDRRGRDRMVVGFATTYAIHRGSQLYFHIARYMLKEKGGHFFCCPK